MAYAVSSCQSSKDFSGKDSDATHIDGFAAITVYCVRGDCLSYVSDFYFGYAYAVMTYKYGEVKYLYIPKAYRNNEFDRIVNEWQVAFKNEGL